MASKEKSTLKAGEQLHKLRDELRVKAHLAGMDAKSLWDELDPRISELEQGLEQQTEEAAAAVSNFAGQILGGFRDFLSRRAPEHASRNASEGTHVRELMNTRHIVCSAEDSLSRAARMMWEADVGSLPVCDSSGRVIAMITDRDICMAAYTQAKPISEIEVSSAMSKEVHCCAPDDSLHTAEQLMRDRQVRRLPVVDAERRVVGIISLADIVRFAKQRTNGVQEEFTETMATICTPREQHAAE